MESITTKREPAEAIALYRSQIVGQLVCREMEHGDLAEALRDLTTERFTPPRSHGARSYSVATLERWYYAFKEGGLDALKPRPRADKGRARVLGPEIRKLLLDIRREHPSASVPLILSTLVVEGKLARGSLSAVTVRRLFAQEGLDRRSLRAGGTRGKVRLRWQAEHPGALWHGDVCHGAPMVVDGQSIPIRIHALLDDASRYVIALEARAAETEADMLALFIRALRRYGTPLHFLAGKLVTVAHAITAPDVPPWIELEEKRHPLSKVDPIANGKMRRASAPAPDEAPEPTGFDPSRVLVDKMLGRLERGGKGGAK